MARVNVGKRIFTDPATGIFKTISVFSEIEPEPEVNQIREFRPNITEIMAQAAREQQAPEPVVAATPPPAPEPPAPPPTKPKRKPRPYKPRPKKAKP